MTQVPSDAAHACTQRADRSEETWRETQRPCHVCHVAEGKQSHHHHHDSIYQAGNRFTFTTAKRKLNSNPDKQTDRQSTTVISSLLHSTT